MKQYRGDDSEIVNDKKQRLSSEMDGNAALACSRHEVKTVSSKGIERAKVSNDETYMILILPCTTLLQ